MKLEFLVADGTSSDNGAVHYRRVGERRPLCNQHRTDWRAITPKQRVGDYAKYIICMKCVQGKRRIENSTFG